MYRKATSILVILASLLALFQPVNASSLLQTAGVVGTGTPQSCTEAALRSVIANTSMITFNCGQNPVTIFITSGEIMLNGSKHLDGGEKITLDAQNRSRIFRTPTFVDFIIENMTLKNGRSVPTGSNDRTYGQGGAIFVDVYSRLKVRKVTFINNSSLANVACFGGGAIKMFGFNTAEVSNSAFIGNKAAFGGAINNLTSDLYVYNSVFDSNEANYDHAITTGGLYCVGGGGAILVDGGNPPKEGGKLTINIINSTFRNNKSGQNGGGVFSYLYSGAKMTIDHSTFEYNVAVMFRKPNGSLPTDAGMGGGLYLGGDESAEAGFTGKYAITNSTINNNHADFTGGGISLHASSLQITNTTITYNEALNNFSVDPYSTHKGLGGGIAMFESTLIPTDTRFSNITVTGNKSGLTGGGIFGVPASDPNLLMAKIENSVVANNLSSGNPVDCQKPLVDLGGNVQWPEPSGFGVRCAAGVLIADPKLGSLAANGGPTKTIALQLGSAAINHANNATCPSLDQRGYTRSGTCDSGAFEYNGRLLSRRTYLPSALR